MRNIIRLAAAATLCAGASAATEQAHKHAHRELGAHVHGEGELQIAIEGRHLEAALEAPGMDIVGFEHHADSAEEIAAVNAAFARLAQPIALLGVPAQAECHVSAIELAIEFEDGHEHGEGHAHEGEHDHAEHDHAEDHAHEAEARHSAFHAEYRLHCHDVEALDALRPGYFVSFPNGEKLDVVVIGETGQHAFEVDAAHPHVSLR